MPKLCLLTGYVYLDLATKDYGGFVRKADRLPHNKFRLAPGYTYRWSGEYEFELRAKERLKLILPVVFFVLLYMVFHSVTEAAVLIFPTFYAMTGGLILQWLLGYNFSVAVWVGYIALFVIGDLHSNFIPLVSRLTYAATASDSGNTLGLAYSP